MWRFIICLCLLWSVAHAERSTPWTQFKVPAPGKSESIGSYAGGCMIGAKALPEKGVGFESIRRYRNRYYGQPDMIDYLQELGRTLTDLGIPPILVGDLSQPRGGLMGYGHRSHQIGLDADLWTQIFGSRGLWGRSGNMMRTSLRLWIAARRRLSHRDGPHRSYPPYGARPMMRE